MKAVTSLASALNLSVVAEGVETDLQVKSLLELGCRRAQGYYFARPAPVTEIDRMLDHEVVIRTHT